MSFGLLAICATALGTVAASAGAASESPGLPVARPNGAPIVLALTATHPTSAALGSLSAHLSSIGLLSPAWLELQPKGRFAYNAPDPFTAGLTQRGARLVPVLADPDHLAGDLLADGALRRRLAMRLGVALRALGARGVVLDWRDLPPSARGRYAIFVHELRLELGPRAQIVVTVPPVRTMRALKSGSYDLRALARPARLLVLAWNEHGPRSEPGPVASLAFWKQTLRTVLRAAPRSRVLMGVPTWGWRWNATAGAGAEQATQAQLFPEATEQALQRPYGARVGADAWVESDRSVQLKLLVARQARIGGVALWVRGGESSATWRQPILAPLR
jgi:spore germination protein YaaH